MNLNPINDTTKTIASVLFKAGVIVAVTLATSKEDREKAFAKAKAEREGVKVNNVTRDDLPPNFERDAAYFTTGLITAARAVNKAHDEDEDCGPAHMAQVELLRAIYNNGDPDHMHLAMRIIQHMTDLAAVVVDDDDLSSMVASILAAELEEERNENP